MVRARRAKLLPVTSKVLACGQKEEFFQRLIQHTPRIALLKLTAFLVVAVTIAATRFRKRLG
jgi:hypothetical protein